MGTPKCLTNRTLTHALTARTPITAEEVEIRKVSSESMDSWSTEEPSENRPLSWAGERPTEYILSFWRFDRSHQSGCLKALTCSKKEQRSINISPGWQENPHLPAKPRNKAFAFFNSFKPNYFMSTVNDNRCSQSCSWHSCFSEIKHLASTFEILIIFLRGVCNIVASDWAIGLFWSEKS